MLAHQVLEIGCSASLIELVADESKGGQMDEERTWVNAAVGGSSGESKLMLLSGAASCPAKRESRCLHNKVLEVSLSRG